MMKQKVQCEMTQIRVTTVHQSFSLNHERRRNCTHTNGMTIKYSTVLVFNFFVSDVFHSNTLCFVLLCSVRVVALTFNRLNKDTLLKRKLKCERVTFLIITQSLNCSQYQPVNGFLNQTCASLFDNRTASVQGGGCGVTQLIVKDVLER